MNIILFSLQQLDGRTQSWITSPLCSTELADSDGQDCDKAGTRTSHTVWRNGGCCMASV